MRHGTAQNETTRNTGWGDWERVGEWDWRVGCPGSHDITQMAYSLSLSSSDLTWLRGLPTPAPTPNPQTNHLAHLQMCNSKRHPAREPRHQNKPRIATWHRHRSNSWLIWTVKYWLIRIPPGISKNGWLSGLHVHQRDTTSWFEHGAKRTRVYT